MKRALLILCLALSASAAELSYKEWLQIRKQVQTAQAARDYGSVRNILSADGVPLGVAKIGELALTEHAAALAEALAELKLYDEAFATISGAIDQIGPRPIANKSQILRGILLTVKSAVYYSSTNYDAALTIAQDARTTLENVAGEFHPQLYRLHAIIGEIHEKKKNFPEAEKAYKDALEFAEAGRSRFTRGIRSLYFERHPLYDGVSLACVSLAEVLAEQQKFKDARKYSLKALKAAEQAYGKKSPGIAYTLSVLAGIDFDLGDQKEFEADIERLYPLVAGFENLGSWAAKPFWKQFEKELQASQPSPEIIRQLVAIYIARKTDFAGLAKELMQISQRDRPDDWNRVAKLQADFRKQTSTHSSAHLGELSAGFIEVARQQRQYGLARENVNENLKIQEPVNDTLGLVASYSVLAEIESDQKKFAEALALRQRVTTLLRGKFGDDSRVADAMDKEAEFLKLLGQELEASDLQAKANDLRKKVFAK